nr:hypothetical protein [Ruminococcus sp.]
DDMNVLISLTNRLFNYLYSDYPEVKEADIMHDQSLDLEIDRYIDAVEEMQIKLVEKDNAIAERDNAIAEKDNTIAEKENAIVEKDNTIAALQARITELEAANL